MSLSGVRKAAMLLMSVDGATAAELLKGLGPDVITNIATEIAYLDAAGYNPGGEGQEVVKDFCKTLKAEGSGEIKTFLSTMLEKTVGVKKAQEIQDQIKGLVLKRDQFIRIRKADSKQIIAALDGEHPQAIAVVLSELTAKKSAEVLGMLPDEVRTKVVKKMVGAELLGRETRTRISQVVWDRIQALNESGDTVPTGSKETLRKIAMMLQGLPRDLREGLLTAMKENDEASASAIRKLMITWEDIPSILDRPLQEALRVMDSQQLAKAMVRADEVIVLKIRSNISERARTLLDEEISLLSTPKKEEIAKAREELVTVLCQMNEKGELAFVED